jgi:2,4-dienoyl-CoA reductase-like NADH-dependent reductase (Old Yellow Enzyme family)
MRPGVGSSVDAASGLIYQTLFANILVVAAVERSVWEHDVTLGARHPAAVMGTATTELGSDEFPLLLSPITVRSFRLRNRLITTGHGAFQPWNPLDSGEQFIEYQRRRAAGGLGMIILQPIFVEPDPSWPLMMGDRMERLARAIHDEGAVAVLQIVNFGGQMSANYNLGGRPLWSFNGMQAPGGEISHRMSDGEIRLMVDAFARAAAVATQAGLDGVELHGAHGYLIHQSYSPWGNDRTDQWGEPLAFSRAVIAATRAAIGPDKIIGFRMAEWDERTVEEGGLGTGQLQKIAGDVVATGEIDYLNTSIGSKAPDYAALAVATYRTSPGHELKFTREMRHAIGAAVPVVGVGRIIDPRMGEEALRNGDCDLVAMTRGHISDPDIAVKVRRGDARRIRMCVGANECNDRKLAGLNIACFHNPDVGREARGPVALAPTPKHVLVIGGGPGGLKAAEIAARRGHHVTVVERGDEPGGQLRHVRSTAARELFHAVDHLVAELDILGVIVILHTDVTRELIAEMAPEAVVLATGARRSTDGAFVGWDSPQVLTSADALETSLGSRVLVLDRLGVNEAPLVAEALIGKGHEITFATPLESMAPYAGFSHRKDFGIVFRRAGARVLTEVDIQKYDGGSASLVDPDGRVAHEIDADAIVAVTAPRPDVGLTSVLDEKGVPYAVIGDAVAPRGVGVAIREADDVARNL